MTETPEVLVLSAITPTTDSIREKSLRYAKLQGAVETHTPYEYQRIREFWDEEDSLVEHGKAQQLAAQYLLMGSLALNTAGRPESKELWSKRYTLAASELYGVPNADLARQLHEARTHGEKERPFEDAAKKVGMYLSEKYADVYDALDLKNLPDMITPDSIATRFKVGLQVLQTRHDSSWNDWTVEHKDMSSLRVDGDEKSIIVGTSRANMHGSQLKPLFTHEVLVHALRAANGAKYDTRLAQGLPGYLDAEEGLGVFMEYAISGNVSEKNIDRYIDIAFALGQIDGIQHTRAELIDLVMERALKRNEQSVFKLPRAEVEKEVYAHVNRIYRGSLGNEHIGIFTKDIAYHAGFVEMGAYITDQLKNGTSVEALIEFLMLGKFDPTNPAHVQYIHEHVMQ